MTPQPPPDDLQGRKLQFEIEKLIGEREKLAIETKLLARPWFFQASYIAAILPIALVSIMAYVSYMNSDLKRDADNSRRELASARSEKAKVEENSKRDLLAARSEKTKLAEQISAARDELTGLNKMLAPRILKPEQARKLAASLKRFTGYPIRVALEGEPEARAYGESLLTVLQDAGWKVNVVPSATRIERYGILARGTDPPSSALTTLVDELVEYGNPVLFLKMPTGEIDDLEIYLKPSFGLRSHLMITDFDEKWWRLPSNWTSKR